MDDWFICFLSGQNYIGFIVLCTKKKGTCCTLWLRCFCIYSVIRVYHLAKMTHQKQRTGKKEDQSHSTVICSVHMVSIRVYIELLKSYSHLIMQLGVALISSDTFLRLQTCRVESQSISSMKRPSAHSHLRNFCDWDQRVTNMLLHNQARPCKAGILSAWMVSVSAATRAIDLPCPKKHKKQFSLLLFCARLPFYSSLNPGLGDWSSFN